MGKLASAVHRHPRLVRYLAVAVACCWSWRSWPGSKARRSARSWRWASRWSRPARRPRRSGSARREDRDLGEHAVRGREHLRRQERRGEQRGAGDRDQHPLRVGPAGQAKARSWSSSTRASSAPSSPPPRRAASWRRPTAKRSKVLADGQRHRAKRSSTRPKRSSRPPTGNTQALKAAGRAQDRARAVQGPARHPRGQHRPVPQPGHDGDHARRRSARRSSTSRCRRKSWRPSTSGCRCGSRWARAKAGSRPSRETDHRRDRSDDRSDDPQHQAPRDDPQQRDRAAPRDVRQRRRSCLPSRRRPSWSCRRPRSSTRSYGDSVFVVEDEEAGLAGDGQDARRQAGQDRAPAVRALGAARGDFVAIAKGVKAGQEVVSAGAFKLRNSVAGRRRQHRQAEPAARSRGPRTADMKFTDVFLRRPVLAIVVNLVIIIAGLQAIRTLNVRQYPRLESATVTVTTVYVGASADLVRGFITTPLERVDRRRRRHRLHRVAERPGAVDDQRPPQAQLQRRRARSPTSARA